MAPRAALILAGGRSSRMGRPKAWLPFGPERLLQRVVRLMSTAADIVVVVAAPDQVLPDLPASVRVVLDPAPGQGPLAGLATGLAHLPGTVDLVHATATDTPFLIPGWYTELAGQIGTADLIMPRLDGRLHPLAAVYRRRPTLVAATGMLAAGQMRLMGLLEQVSGRVIDAHDLARVDPALQTLRNLNTWADYRQALFDAGLADPGP